MTRYFFHRLWDIRCNAGVALYVLLSVFLAVDTNASNNEPLPAAGFAELNSAVTEQNGRIELKVAVADSHELSGNLLYSVDGGTAERGADFNSAEFATIGQGRETAIVIELRDDESIEDTETIRVTLQPGEGYRLGPARQHTVSIRDNDANWRVVHDVDGMRFDYGMQIIRNGDDAEATVTSDGLNGLPAGTYEVELSATDNNRFEADIGPITVGAHQTLLGTELARNFRLFADPNVGGHSIDYDRGVIGAVTETWTAAAGASHLTTRDKPISGTFVMSRAVGDSTRPVKKDEKEPVTPADWGDESECAAADLTITDDFMAKPNVMPDVSVVSPVGLHEPVGVSLQSSSLGQPFAPHIPYPDFISETLNRARAELYYDKAQTPEAKDAVAFLYKALLYERENVGAETYIRARFDRVEDLWDCAARERAHQAAHGVIGALRYAPWNRELRWALLDIYYDIAVAEKALAREKHVAVAEIMLKEPAPGESLIDREIALLEEALPLYRKALAGYMRVMRHTYGVDLADFETNPVLQAEPFGYYMFRQEVPLRSPLAALFKNADDEWVLPADARAGDEQPRLFQGHKDVTLLFELLRDYLRTAEQLAKRYVMRSEPSSDFRRAEELVGTALLATWLEGNALLAMFPDTHETGGSDPRSGLREAVAGWRYSYRALGQIRSLLDGNTNVLGFPDDFLVVAQSVISDDESSSGFNSYSYFKERVRDTYLPRAEEHFQFARESYKKYHDRYDQFAQQFVDRTEQYNERLREIVGVNPGESGYDQPEVNAGGRIKRQLRKIETARFRVDTNRQTIQNLEEQIRDEVERRGREKGISNAMSEVYVKYGNRQASLTEEIAKINGDQMFWNNMVAAAGSIAAAAGTAAIVATGGAATPLVVAASGVVSGTASIVNGFYQESKEETKGRKQARKERLDAQQQMELQGLRDDLSDTDSEMKIRELLRSMNTLALETTEVAAVLQDEIGRLDALYLEKKDLERRKAESDKNLADRYFADPSHHALKNAAVLRVEPSFATAQRWVFMLIRAAEYKWNQAFEHTTAAGASFTRESLFRTRSVQDLRELYSALGDWDNERALGQKNDNSSKQFSMRRDLLGYNEKYFELDTKKWMDATYLDPDTGKKIDAEQAFRNFIKREDNYLKTEDPENVTGLMTGFKYLRLKFSTAFVPETGGIFQPDQWLEKITHLNVTLRGGYVGPESIVSGRLCYGGVSLIRNQNRGSPDPDEPDRLLNETTAYSTRYWFIDENGQWSSKEEFCSPINIQVGGRDPKRRPSEYDINTFKEYSTATTGWTLYIPVESQSGNKMVDVDTLRDIVFHIHYYSYVRN